MSESWAKKGSGVARTKPGKRPKAARAKKRKKTPEELALDRESARLNREEEALYPPGCSACGVYLLGPKDGLDEGGFVDVATSPPGRKPHGALIRQRFCSSDCMAAKTAEGAT